MEMGFICMKLKDKLFDSHEIAKYFIFHYFQRYLLEIKT